MLPSYPITRSGAFAKLEEMSKAVQSLTASVTMQAKLGGLKSNDVTDYPTLSGTLLFQKPNDIRIRATFLTAGAFDMISDGSTYQVLVPWENKLFKGQELGPPVGMIFPKPLHNVLAELRPRQLKAAMLLDILPYLSNPRIQGFPETIAIPLERRRYYVIDFVDTSVPDEFQLLEKVWIDLSTPTLDISRRQIFGKDGIVETDVRFSGWAPIASGAVSLPSVVDIQFPEKDMSVKLTIDGEGLSLNPEIPMESFQLPEHADAEVILIEPRQVLNSR
jgi:hypothetical protein